MSKNKKKILYIITQSEFGGAQRYLLELITRLEPQKYDITVAAGSAYAKASADGPGGDFLDRIKAQNCQIWRLKHLVREINPIKDIRAYFELKNLIYTTKPDILQLLSTKAGILGSLAYSHIRKFASHSRNSYVIYRIGGWAFLEDIPWWKKQLYVKAEKWTSKFKDKIIVNCEAHRQLAIKLNIAPPEKIITIYNGINLGKLTFLPREQARQKLFTNNQTNQTKNPDQKSESLVTDSEKSAPIVEKHRSFSPNENYYNYSKCSNFVKSNCGQLYKNDLKQPISAGRESNPHFPFGENDVLPIKLPAREQTASPLYHNHKVKYIIGTIANFYQNKGLKYLIQAISRLQLTAYSLQLVIIGDGIELQNLEKLIYELKLEDQVFLPGRIKEAYKYLKAFDIFVLASIKEGQPWSLMEAMAAELPCIATNIAAVPEMITNGQSGLLVKPKNPQAIAEKINYLINNPDIAKNLGQNAQQVITQKFTVQKMVSQTEKLY